MKRVISGELNDSVSDPGATESFLENEAISKASALRNKNARESSRPRSVIKSIRESVGFIETTRYGETRVIEEYDDDDVQVGRPVSIRQRKSEKIEKLGMLAAAASIFKAFVGLGILFLPN